MKIDLFILPYEFTLEYWGLKPSACTGYPEAISPQRVPYKNLLALFLMRPWKSSRRILCLHWSTELYGSKYLLKSFFLLGTNFIGLLLLKYVAHIKFVWVMHNRYAHDYPHPMIDAIGRALVGWMADAIVAQQKETERELKEKFPHKIIKYISHVNFVDAYGPRRDTSSVLQEEFNLSKEDIVLLSFGAIRPYKKIEHIIDAIAAVSPEARKRIAFVVAGKGSGEYIVSLKKRAEGKVRIYIREGFVPDEKVPEILASATYSVFYFDDSERTSGSLLVSLSYGLPVIARNIPGAEYVQDTSGGHIFNTTEELSTILESVVNNPRPNPEAVTSVVAPYGFPVIEQAYRDLYESLV